MPGITLITAAGVDMEDQELLWMKLIGIHLFTNTQTLCQVSYAFSCCYWECLRCHSTQVLYVRFEQHQLVLSLPRVRDLFGYPQVIGTSARKSEGELACRQVNRGFFPFSLSACSETVI